MFTHYNHSPHKSSKGLSTYTRGMQCIECFIALPFATCIHNNRLISRSSPLPTVACNTKGGKCLVMRLGCLKRSWNNIAWVTMCSSGWLCACVHCTHSVSLLATAVGNKVSKQSEAAWRVCKSRMRVQHLSTNNIDFLWLQLFHISALSPEVHVHSGYLLNTYSCGIRILSVMGSAILSIWSPLFLSAITGGLVQSFRSSSLAVAQQGLFAQVVQASLVRVLTS